MAERFIATYRQLTGLPFIHHAYVMDRETGEVVSACSHRHGARGGHGEKKAQACAEKMLSKYLRERAKKEE